MKAAAVVVISFCLAGCAVHRRATYRITSEKSGGMLLPPGVTNAESNKWTVSILTGRAHAGCSQSNGVIAIRQGKNGVVLTIDRETLDKQAAGWLNDWAAELEKQGCVEPNEGWAAAERIVESVPLSLVSPFRLLHTGEVDIGAASRLKVESPVFREGTLAEALSLAETQTTEDGNTLNLTARAPDDLLGFETDWYGLAARAKGPGLSIVPLSAERNLQGQIERLSKPAKSAFAFPEDAAFYRLFYKQDQTEFTVLALAARTRAELEEQSRKLRTDAGACKKPKDAMCLAVPKGIGVNAYVAVTVNGREVPVPWPATVHGALDSSGIQVREIPPSFTIHKPYRGRLVKVEFDPASDVILSMPLEGGETIHCHEAHGLTY